MTKTTRIRPYSNHRDYFDLHVSATQKEMNAHAERWAKSLGIKMQHDAATAGIVQPSSIRMFPEVYRDEEWRSICFCRMFLSQEKLTEQIIAHECLHVAMCHERHVEMFDMRFDMEIDEDEERLAHYLGRTVEGVMKALRKGGYRIKRER